MYKIDMSRIGAFAHPVVVEGGILQTIKNMLERDGKLSPVRAETLGVLNKRSHTLVGLIEHVPDHSADFEYKAWYEEAMVASNEAGYACVSAAETIRDLARQLREANAELSEFERLSCDQPSDKMTS